MYPPGQFSPWNTPALRAVSAAGRAGLAAGSGTSNAEYSRLAVSDPSADATATQTWAVLDDAQLDELDEWGTASADAPARTGQDGSARSLTGESHQTGPRGFFESATGAAAAGPAPAGPGAPPGSPAPPGPPGSPAPPGPPGPGPSGFTGRAGTTGDAAGPGHPGEAGYPGRTDPSLRAARPGGRLAARQGRQQEVQEFPDLDTGAGTGAGADTDTSTGSGAGGTRGSRSAARGRKPRKPSKPPSRARMWLMPLVMMVVVIVLITVAYLHFARGQANAPAAAPTARQTTASSSASPTLGPWRHITTRADDPQALSLTELFPARYSSGGTVARTVQKSGRNCPTMMLGNKLRAAVRKAHCSQVMRASYLSAGQKIMATVGVLNLANVTDAERAGRATGATAFIKQLPGAHGPTKNLMKGTGLEEAQIKGHYLILTWAEFTNLKAPGSAARRKELDTFSRQLVASTAGISLTSRMVFGKPEIP